MQLTCAYTKYIHALVDVYYLYRGETFVWDGLKAIENRAKHGVQFERACEVFFDRLSQYSDATADDESRMAVLGMDESEKLLFVVHVQRDVDMVRIISARVATSQERKQYENS
jgi:uncharacterized DUF497 family protein